jgi:hypothetical protein
MLKRRIVIFNFLILIISSYSIAMDSKVGTTGANFLKIPIAARQSAMAGAFVAVGDDVNTVEYNPAGLSRIATNELTATHVEYLADLQYDYVGYVLPLAVSRVGFSASSLHSTMRETDTLSLQLGEIILSDKVYTLTVARPFSASMYWGVNLKGIGSRLGGYSAWAFAADLGLLYSPESIENLNFGFAVQNLGTPLKMLSQKDSLPVNYKIGVAKKIPDSKLLFAVELSKASDNSSKISTGMEFAPLGFMVLRGGYRVGYDLDTYTAGVGFIFKPKGFDEFQIDYAYNPMGDLGNTHRFSLITRF